MKRLALCLILVGCGGDDGGGSSGNGPLSVDELGGRLASASCSLQFECCSSAEIMEQYMGITFEGMPIETEEQCVSFSTAVFVSFGSNAYKASIEKGRAEYDADAAGDCVALLDGLTCADYREGALPIEGSGCRPFIIGKVANGGACSQDYECTSENCVGEENPLGGTPTEGACAPMPGQGDECEDECADGLYCKYSPSTGMDTCEPLEADGNECLFDDDCASDRCGDADTCEPAEPVCTGA